MGVSYEGFAWSGPYGLVRGEEHGRWNRVVGSDWWWGAVRSPPRSLSLREERCQSQNSGHGEKFGLNLY